jgi:hypothetical protein
MSRQFVDSLEVRRDGAQRSGEGLATERKGLAHGSVRRAEDDEGIDVGRERRGEGAVRVTVAHGAAPRVDVRRHERDRTTGGDSDIVRSAQTFLVDVPRQRIGVGVVRATGVGGGADGGSRDAVARIGCEEAESWGR